MGLRGEVLSRTCLLSSGFPRSRWRNGSDFCPPRSRPGPHSLPVVESGALHSVQTHPRFLSKMPTNKSCCMESLIPLHWRLQKTSLWTHFQRTCYSSRTLLQCIQWSPEMWDPAYYIFLKLVWYTLRIQEFDILIPFSILYILQLPHLGALILIEIWCRVIYMLAVLSCSMETWWNLLLLKLFNLESLKQALPSEIPVADFINYLLWINVVISKPSEDFCCLGWTRASQNCVWK